MQRGNGVLRRSASVLALAAALSLAGCEQMRDWPWGWPFVQRPSAAPSSAKPASGGDAPQHPFAEFTQPPDPSEPTTEILLVQFDLLRVELPSAPLRHSLNLWNHVDEMRVDPAVAPVLAQNGVRMGVASAEAWEPMQAILKSSQATTAIATQTLQAGLPLLLQVGEFTEPAPVFVYGPSGELVGKTLQPGRKMIRLDYEVPPPKRDRVRLLIELDVFPPESTSAWVLSPAQSGSLTPSHQFRELLASLVLVPGEMLVIGPHENTTNEFLTGSRYFTHSAAGQPMDTLLLITVNLQRQKLRK
ncbi:MAG: hypothetical protein IT449_11640 [Phycisphaerales bacterium]|nr:hypothetical protein [Phycisphaerales bacterium]